MMGWIGLLVIRNGGTIVDIGFYRICYGLCFGFCMFFSAA